jgi:hypothetical protein
LIEAAQPQPFTIRFHLHPNVTASLQQDNEAVLLRLPSGQGWRLRADGTKISGRGKRVFRQRSRGAPNKSSLPAIRTDRNRSNGPSHELGEGLRLWRVFC